MQLPEKGPILLQLRFRRVMLVVMMCSVCGRTQTQQSIIFLMREVLTWPKMKVCYLMERGIRLRRLCLSMKMVALYLLTRKVTLCRLSTGRVSLFRCI
ncbi:hypothetical protein BKH30_10085 [Actinomyces oris]|uniref:Uncharacterized protein n=1 Tax=Actinomyces oris TaxID=544580 RepID=A0A1Q8VNY7_9ACTO|nr:hypothetical protein BKH30_10085 [Actinomyces oris]